MLAEKTGFKVPVQAIRVIEKDGVSLRGVYILRGNIVSFRLLNAVYSGKDFLLTAPKERTSKDPYSYVSQYDEIILGGKKLYDGALLFQ